MSVDPLTKDYASLTPYQFASNTPIQAIDLDGLEAFFIPGTTAKQNESWLSNPHSVEILKDIAGNSTSNNGFEWKELNGFLNNQEDRRKAAENLAKHVIKNMSESGEDITLIGHSHGGNVAIQAAPIIKRYLELIGDERMVSLITIATPAYNGKDDPENPENSNADSHMHFYNTIDVVQTFLSSLVSSKKTSRIYENTHTDNIPVDESEFKETKSKVVFSSKLEGASYKIIEVESKSGLKAHSFHTTHPEIMKKAIEKK